MSAADKGAERSRRTVPAGNYDLLWWTGVALSLVAVLLHLPIDERVAEPVGQVSTATPGN